MATNCPKNDGGLHKVSLNIERSVIAIKPGKTLILLAILVFSVSLIIYTATLAPGLLWGGGDFATFQTRAYLLEIESGIFGHPLWVILTHPFTRIPIRDVAWRANFATAMYGSLALVFVFLVSFELTRSISASLLGTGALMVSHTFWTYAVMPKVYSLNALFPRRVSSLRALNASLRSDTGHGPDDD